MKVYPTNGKISGRYVKKVESIKQRKKNLKAIKINFTIFQYFKNPKIPIKQLHEVTRNIPAKNIFLYENLSKTYPLHNIPAISKKNIYLC